jgi:hypothetical protein
MNLSAAGITTVGFCTGVGDFCREGGADDLRCSLLIFTTTD